MFMTRVLLVASVAASMFTLPSPSVSASFEMPCPGHMIREVVRLEAERFKAEDAHNTGKAADIWMREGRIDEVCSIERSAQDYSLAASDYEDVRDFRSARGAAKKSKTMYERILRSTAYMKSWAEARAAIADLDATLKRLPR
jgi:hypothetical protein